MASSSSLLPLLVLLLAFQLFLYVKSDQALISHLCNKTSDPVTCSDCLNSDSSSKTSDVNGLALKTVSCAKNATIAMFESISKLSKNTPMGSPLKKIFASCDFNASAVLELYDGVSFNINRQDYATAKEITLEFVMPICNACLNEFDRQQKVVVPSGVLYRTQAVNKDVKVMMDILDNI